MLIPLPEKRLFWGLGLLLTATAHPGPGSQKVLQDSTGYDVKDKVIEGFNDGFKTETSVEICGGCVDREVILRPGVGLDLSVGYGTAAIRYHDRSIVDVGKLVGSDEYKEMMGRLSPPVTIKETPFDNIADRIRYNYDQAQRALRRARGLPSTTDIEVLSAFITQLFALTVSKSSVPLGDKVVISTKSIPNLPAADLDEALKFANLTRLISPKSQNSPISQTNTGFAGLGYGLCKNWALYMECQEEEVNGGVKNLLTISFTNDLLAIETAFAYTAYWIYPDIHVEYPTLGFNNTSHTDEYWTSIKERITTSLKATNILADTLLLMGEAADQPEFKKVVFEALGEIGGWIGAFGEYKVEEGVLGGVSSVMVAARGAAEFAKRIQGEPEGCIEGDWCHNRVPGEDGVPES